MKPQETFTLGKVIAKQRAVLGLSLKDLANLTRKENGYPISAQYLHDVEKDRRTPSPHVLGELAKSIRVDVVYLRATMGQAPDEVAVYLKEHPDVATNIAGLFARARTVNFTDWNGVDLRSLKSVAK